MKTRLTLVSNNTAAQVLRFRITLLGIKPPIWRIIEVLADCTFWDLHCAIQDAVGWQNMHLFEFELGGTGRRRLGSTRIGVPIDDAFMPEMTELLPAWKAQVVARLGDVNAKARYVYDFGDGWEHDVTLEAIAPVQPGVRYPRCDAGERRGPPEDVGGPPGFEQFLEAMADAGHAEHAEYRAWIGRRWDPDAFDPRKVKFGDPKVRLRRLMKELGG